MDQQNEKSFDTPIPAISGFASLIVVQGMADEAPVALQLHHSLSKFRYGVRLETPDFRYKRDFR